MRVVRNNPVNEAQRTPPASGQVRSVAQTSSKTTSERPLSSPQDVPGRASEQQRSSSISANEIVRAEEAFRRLGIGKWQARQMRRAGLRLIYVGGKSILLGEDLLSFLRERRDGVFNETTTSERREDPRQNS